MSALPPKAHILSQQSESTHSVRSRMSAKCQTRKWTGSSIEFSRVGGVLIRRTASKLISRRNGRALRRLAHPPQSSKSSELTPNASFSQLCRRSAESPPRCYEYYRGAHCVGHLNRVLAKKAE